MKTENRNKFLYSFFFQSIRKRKKKITLSNNSTTQLKFQV